VKPTKAQFDIAYKRAMRDDATEEEKQAFLRMASNTCAEELLLGLIEEPASPFSINLTHEIAPETYHNTFSVALSSEAFEVGIMKAHEELTKLHVQLGGEENLDPPSYLPMREHEALRIPNLNADDEYRAAALATIHIIPFFPEGAISILEHAIMLCGIGRQHVRVEWLAEHATVIAYVTGIETHETDTIMREAISPMPLGIGIDVRAEQGAP
jgi:hypothetical protein